MANQRTPLGKAEARFLWNSDSFEVSASYGCFMDETKENWWWPNTQVRLLCGHLAR